MSHLEKHGLFYKAFVFAYQSSYQEFKNTRSADATHDKKELKKIKLTGVGPLGDSGKLRLRVKHLTRACASYLRQQDACWTLFKLKFPPELVETLCTHGEALKKNIKKSYPRTVCGSLREQTNFELDIGSRSSAKPRIARRVTARWAAEARPGASEQPYFSVYRSGAA